MNQGNKRTSFTVIGVLLIIAGIIMFIISAVQLYDVQTTTSRWADGFMQDYQARTNAENSIPCYMFMVLAVVMVIAGIIMLCIRPKAVTVMPPTAPYNNFQPSALCPNCKGQVRKSDVFCRNCGYDLTLEASNFKTACPNCGQINGAEDRFCSQCGKEI